MRKTQTINYGLLGLPLAFGALPVYLFVPDFYSRSGLLDLSLLGWILLGTRLADAVADPFFGWLSDQGARKTFLAIALVPFALGYLALFNPAAGVDPALWLFGSILACTLGFSAAMIAYQSWGAALGAHTSERLTLAGARESFGLLGVVLASLLPSLLSDNSAQGLQQSGWVFLPMLIVIAAITLGVLPASKPTHAASMGFIKSLSQVLADSTYRRLVAVFIANGIASAFPATLFVFFVADVLGAQSLTGLLLGLYFISAAMGVPVWVSLSKKFGRPKAWFAAMLLAVLAFVGAGALGNGDWPWFAVICFASGIAMGADLTIPSSIVADLGESRGHTASYFGVWNLIAKMNLALAAGVALPLLGWMGYTPGTGAQTDVLVMAYVLLPLSLKLGAMILLWCWRKPLSFST